MIRRLLLAVTAMCAVVVSAPAFASAASDSPPPPAADAGTQTDVTWLNLDASLVLWVTALAIPLIGGILLRSGATKRTQTAVGIVLNALNALLVTATTEGGDAVLTAPLVTNFIQSTVISMATLYGWWKPSGVDDKLVATGGIIGPKAA